MSTPTPVLAARQASIPPVRHSRMASSYPFAGALEMMGAAMSFFRNEEICGIDEVALPMSRQDIADFLGLTIETVSRAIGQLEDIHAIALPSSRRIALCNRAMLSRLTAS